MRGRSALLLLLALAAPYAGPPAPGAAQEAVSPRGALFIVGGGSRPDTLMARFVDLAGGPGAARLAVLPMASADPAASGESAARQLRRLGAEVRTIVVTREEADAAAPALLDGVTGVWFPGGQQSRLADVLQGTVLHRALLDAHARGAVVGGTSAGAAVMSDSMISGAQILAGSDTAGYHGDTFERIARGSIPLSPGLGFLPGVVVDQHFVRRERHNRLLSVVLERGGLGAGIDESTALIVLPDGTWTVAGESVAVVYDARAARLTPGGAALIGAAGVRLHVLPAGARFDPSTGRAELPAPGGRR